MQCEEQSTKFKAHIVQENSFLHMWNKNLKYHKFKTEWGNQYNQYKKCPSLEGLQDGSKQNFVAFFGLKCSYLMTSYGLYDDV